MTEKADIHRWWEGLTPEQRQAAIQGARTGEVSDQVWATLAGAGLADPAEQDRTPSDPVLRFLKMQHD